MNIKEERLQAARRGDRDAQIQLLQNGVAFAEILTHDNEDDIEERKHKLSEYLFVVYNDNSDYTNIEMVTSDLKKAFEYAYDYRSLMVWLDSEEEESFDLDLRRYNLEDVNNIFQNELDGVHSKLAELILPLIQEKISLYEEEKRKREQEQESQIIAKELKELERLKAKYEK